MKNLFSGFSFPFHKSNLRFTCLLLLLTLFINAKSFSQAGWVVQNSGVDIDLVSVSFYNNMTGFCVGSNKIIKTTNGGSSWFIFDSAFVSDTYAKILFIDQNTGFISFNMNGTYRTTNSGVNWEQASPYVISPNFGFVDNNFGWIFGYSNMVVTADRGNTWNMTGGFPSSHGSPTHGFMGSTTFGTAVGNFDDFMHNKMYMYIWKTNNGGSSWECVSGNIYGDPCAYTIINGFRPPPMFSKTFVVDDYTAFLYGGSQDMRTENSGTSWSNLNIGASASGFEFINHNTGFAACGGGIIKYTTNSGSTWIDQISTVNVQLNSADMLNAQTGWIAGASGTILKTTTGGLVLPLEPVLLSPANNSTGNQLTLTLDWYDNVVFVYYRIQIATDTGFSSIIYDNNSLSQSQCVVPAGLLNYNTDYYWRTSCFVSAG